MLGYSVYASQLSLFVRFLSTTRHTSVKYLFCDEMLVLHHLFPCAYSTCILLYEAKSHYLDQVGPQNNNTEVLDWFLTLVSLICLKTVKKIELWYLHHIFPWTLLYHCPGTSLWFLAYLRFSIPNLNYSNGF